MINSVNGFGGQTQQVRQNPDEYAKLYAEQNGISVEEAKVELKSKYGDPQEQNGMSGIGSFGNFNNYSIEDIQNIQDEIAGLEEKLFGEQASTSNSFLNSFMNFFNGGNSSSEQNDMINPETGTVTGPQKEGDPQFHINPSTGEESGPQKEGDFQSPNMPSFGENNGMSNMFQQFRPQMGMPEEYKNIFN